MADTASAETDAELKARKRRELEQRLKELQRENRAVTHEVEVGEEKIKELSSAYVVGLEVEEKKEERLTNVMHRKLSKLEQERLKLEKHLELEEESKRNLERRYRKIEAENQRLRETLKIEEARIVNRLKKPLTALQKQKAELAKRLNEESELDTLISHMEQLREELGGAASTDVGDMADVASEVTSIAVHQRRPSQSSTIASAAATPCETDRKGREREGLTSSSLKQLEGQGAALSQPPTLSAFDDHPPPSDTDYGTTGMRPGSVLGSFVASEHTPRMAPAQHPRTFSPLPSAMPSYAILQTPVHTFRADVQSCVSTEDEGEQTYPPKTRPGYHRTSSVMSTTSSLADDTAMIQQLQREIHRLHAWQKKAAERTQAYERRIAQLQREISRAQAAKTQTVTELEDISQRLTRTNSLANDLSAQNEGLEWSVDRCSMASSVVATPRTQGASTRGGAPSDSETSTPVQARVRPAFLQKAGLTAANLQAHPSHFQPSPSPMVSGSENASPMRQTPSRPSELSPLIGNAPTPVVSTPAGTELSTSMVAPGSTGRSNSAPPMAGVVSPTSVGGLGGTVSDCDTDVTPRQSDSCFLASGSA